jgi:hypothetical protein
MCNAITFQSNVAELCLSVGIKNVALYKSFKKIVFQKKLKRMQICRFFFVLIGIGDQAYMRDSLDNIPFVFNTSSAPDDR